MPFHESLHHNRIRLLLILPLFLALYLRVIPDMVKVWYNDANYSHGFIVPVIALYLLRQRSPSLKALPVRPDNLGLAIIFLGLLQLLCGWFSAEYFTTRSSFIVVLAGLILFLFGREVLKGMAVPVGYLLFMVPVPYIAYDMVAFPLKLLVTRLSVFVLHALGIAVMREGNIIMFPAATFEVADACSGIRSLVSLVALAAAYAVLQRTTMPRCWLIILSALPIAVAANTARVVITGILAQWWGAKAAEGFFHEFAGMAVFLCALVLLISFGELIRRYGVTSNE